MVPWSVDLTMLYVASAAGVAVSDRAAAAAAQGTAEVAVATGGQGAQQPGRGNGAADGSRNQEGRLPSGLTLYPIALWVHVVAHAWSWRQWSGTEHQTHASTHSINFAADLLARLLDCEARSEFVRALASTVTCPGWPKEPAKNQQRTTLPSNGSSKRWLEVEDRLQRADRPSSSGRPQ